MGLAKINRAIVLFCLKCKECRGFGHPTLSTYDKGENYELFKDNH